MSAGTNAETLSRYLEAHKMYSKTSRRPVIEKIEGALMDGDFPGALKLLEGLPTKDQLMHELSQRVKGKPLYRTMVKLREGRTNSGYAGMKVLTSIMTHILIECEHGDDRFMPLLFDMNDVYQGMLAKYKGAA